MSDHAILLAKRVFQTGTLIGIDQVAELNEIPLITGISFLPLASAVFATSFSSSIRNKTALAGSQELAKFLFTFFLVLFSLLLLVIY